jgi:hypothetical protein
MTTPDPTLPQADLDPVILNETLDLALEWGEYFAKPTQPRLAKLHADLTEAQLNAYDAAVRVVMSRTFGMLYESPETDRKSVERFVHAKHPWVNANNISRMHSQGMYYAMR